MTVPTGPYLVYHLALAGTGSGSQLQMWGHPHDIPAKNGIRFQFTREQTKCQAKADGQVTQLRRKAEPTDLTPA